ncbi:MAG: hypothetical protein ACRESG_03390 [Gammaproteobacteria bacterium]
MTEPNLLGPELEPSRGGMTRLQQAIQQSDSSGFRPGYWIGAALTASVVALSVFIWQHGTSRQSQIHQAVQEALASPPKTYFDNAAYMELPSHRRNVRILLVGSLRPSK